MRLQIRTPGIELIERIRTHVEGPIQFVLDRMADRISGATAVLPVTRGDPGVLRERDPCPYGAIDRVTGRHGPPRL